MKNILLVIAVLFVGGCCTPLNLEEPFVTQIRARGALREKVIGTYEIKKDGNALRVVLLENGIVEAYSNGKKKEKEVTWKIVDREIHGVEEDGNITGIRINKDGGITFIEKIDKDGKRKDLSKEEQLTLKKIK